MGQTPHPTSRQWKRQYNVKEGVQNHQLRRAIDFRNSVGLSSNSGYNSFHGRFEMEENGDVDDDGAELHDENPYVVQRKPVFFIIRSSPTPSSGFDKVMVAVPNICK